MNRSKVNGSKRLAALTVPAALAAGCTRVERMKTGWASAVVVALVGTGCAFALGNNHVGELGDGTTTDRTSPVGVLPLASTTPPPRPTLPHELHGVVQSAVQEPVQRRSRSAP